MSAITWPANTTEIIDDIRSVIGRDIVVYTISKVDCPTCNLDPITDTSTDSFCPTCSGVGYLITLSGTTLEAHITWGVAEQLGWKSGGTLDVGDCRVQIKHTVANENLIDNADYLVVDNRELEVKYKHPRGVKQINRILVDLKERKYNG